MTQSAGGARGSHQQFGDRAPRRRGDRCAEPDAQHGLGHEHATECTAQFLAHVAHLHRLGAKAGATVSIWVDESGEVSKPPLTTEGAALDAIFLSLLLWSAAAGSMALLHLATRFAHQRIRLRQWAKDWERIAPDWTGR